MKDKDEFIESIEMFMNKPSTKKLITEFGIKKMQSEISSSLLKKSDSDNNSDIISKYIDILDVMKKYKLINDKEIDVIKNSLENSEGVFTTAFQMLFDDQNFAEFYETVTLALGNQNKNEGNKNNNNWNSEIIKTNYKKVKNKIDEKYYNTLEELYNTRNENLFNSLKDINNSNIEQKVEKIRTLILKKDLTAN